MKYLVFGRKPEMLEELAHLIEVALNDINDNRQHREMYAGIRKDIDGM